VSGRGHRTRRRAELSQHFLRSRAPAASLVAHSPITPSDLVIEIGPGRGILTRELAARCESLVAVEIDGRLRGELAAELRGVTNVELVHGDFLGYPLPDAAHKVFASIPYGRTARIFRRLVDAPVPPEDIYLVVQREAAEHFTGRPHAPESLSSLQLKPWWQVEVLRRLRRTDFDPPPQVDSAVLWLARRTRPLVDRSEGELFRGFIATCFGRRGNTVRRCLGGAFTGRQIGRLARDLGFDPGGPPSALAFDQWLALFRFLTLEAHIARTGVRAR
jgi:23S rRNA (adenine-N6)-dimethyltransferase